MARLDARLRVLFLLGVAGAAFAAKSLPLLGAIAVALAACWLLVGLGARRLLRQFTKLWGFAALILVSYALTAEDPALDRWSQVSALGFRVAINVSGLATGLAMLLRVVALVLASQVARAGDPRAIALGLARLGAPKAFAASLDAVLALLGVSGAQLDLRTLDLHRHPGWYSSRAYRPRRRELEPIAPACVPRGRLVGAALERECRVAVQTQQHRQPWQALREGGAQREGRIDHEHPAAVQAVRGVRRAHHQFGAQPAFGGQRREPCGQLA